MNTVEKRNGTCLISGEMSSREISFARQGAAGRSPEARPAAQRLERSGFTLIELLVVLVLMGVVLSFAVPRLNFGYYAVRGAASSTSSVLVRAQRRAVQAQHDVVVSFDTLQNRLRIHDDADNDGTVDAGETVSWEPLVEGVRLKKGSVPALLSAGGAVSFRVVQDGMPGVVFYRSGAASEEGIFYLGTARPDTASSRHDDVRAGRIQRSTGRLQWYRYANGEWEMTGA